MRRQFAFKVKDEYFRGMTRYQYKVAIAKRAQTNQQGAEYCRLTCNP